MKYLTDGQMRSQLAAGRTIEHLRPFSFDGEIGIVAYVCIQGGTGVTVQCFECEDVGDEEYIDIYSFPPADPDVPYGTEESFSDVESALVYCRDVLGLPMDRWLGQGMIQDEYKERKMGEP